MWIREPIELKKSLVEDLNFLWKDPVRNIYIMDNHLGALWCWLEKLDKEESYSLFHVDQHWDLAEMNESEIETLRNEDLKDIDYFTSLRCHVNSDFALVAYHNYITPLPYLRPNLQSSFFTAHSNQVFPDISDPRFHLLTIESFFDDLDERISTANEGRILFNIDLDFFFCGAGFEAYQCYGDSYLTRLTETIRPLLDKTILTVAWSPEFCGNYNRAAAICKILCKNLSITCPSSDPKLSILLQNRL